MLQALVILERPAVAAADWPRFLGPNHDGSTRDDPLIENWKSNGLTVRWSIGVGEGYSGPAIAGSRLVTLDADGSSEFLFAVDVDSGDEIWRLRLGPEPRDWYGGLGPRVTPTITGDRVVVMSAEGDLIAVAAGSGRVLWRRPVRKSLAGRFPAEGYSASALVHKQTVYLPVGGADGRSLAAFDLTNGRLIFSTGNDRAAYASPVPATLAAREQIIFLTAAELSALDPQSGSVLWRFDWPTFDGVNAASPLVIGDERIFVSAGYDQGGALLEVSSTGETLQVEEVWRSRVMRNHFNNSVYHDGILFGFDESNLAAVEASDGTRLWRERGLGKGSLILVSGHLVILSEGGELILARPSRDRFDPLDRISVLSGRSWTPPAVARGRVFLRSRERLICLQPASGPRSPR